MNKRFIKIALVLSLLLSTAAQAFTADITDYGATANDTTDDTVAIRQALTSGADKVVIPGGTYHINSALTVPNSVNLLIGDGAMTSKILYHGNSSGINIVPTSNRQLKLQGFTIEAVGGSNGFGVYYNGSNTTAQSYKLLKVSDVDFIGFNIGLETRNIKGLEVILGTFNGHLNPGTSILSRIHQHAGLRVLTGQNIFLSHIRSHYTTTSIILNNVTNAMMTGSNLVAIKYAIRATNSNHLTFRDSHINFYVSALTLTNADDFAINNLLVYLREDIVSGAYNAIWVDSNCNGNNAITGNSFINNSKAALLRAMVSWGKNIDISRNQFVIRKPTPTDSGNTGVGIFLPPGGSTARNNTGSKNIVLNTPYLFFANASGSSTNHITQ